MLESIALTSVLLGMGLGPVETRESSGRIRRIYSWPDGDWNVFEILDFETLQAFSRALDLGLDVWLPELEAGTARAFVLSQVDSPLRRTVFFKAIRTPDGGWDLGSAYHPGMNRVDSEARLQQIGEVLFILEQQDRQ